MAKRQRNGVTVATWETLPAGADALANRYSVTEIESLGRYSTALTCM